MANKIQAEGVVAVDGDVFLDELEPGSGGSIMIMICRKWDVYTKKGMYMSTDFIISDEKGNLMHCISKHNRSYKFVDSLDEGSLYVLAGFTVLPNRETFRILKDSPYMLEFDGSTSVKKADGDVGSFIRHLFQVYSFDELVPTDSQYLVDVVGYVMCVGEPKTKSNGAQTVEFFLTNESGRQLPVTLWGSIGEEMIKRKEANPEAYVCILTSMSTKKYLGEIGCSSTSSTQIIDDIELPVLQSFKAALSSQDLSTIPIATNDSIPTIGTLAELLRWGRDKKARLVKEEQTILFRNKLEIVDIRTRSGWYLITCSSGRCRKGITRVKSGFWCTGCNSSVLYPHTRFKIQMDVKDDTMSIVVVLFDEPAERLLSRTAKSLMDEEQKGDWDGDVLPPVLRNLIGTKHVFEIKGHIYYQANDYEAFNCSRIFPDEPANNDVTPGSKKNTVGSKAGTSSTVVIRGPETLKTPAKTKEPTKRKLVLDAADDGPPGQTRRRSRRKLTGSQSGDSVVVGSELNVAGTKEKPNYTNLEDVVPVEDAGGNSGTSKRRFTVESDSDSGESGGSQAGRKA